MYLVYYFLSILLTPFMYLWALVRLYRGKEDKNRITERFAITNLARPEGKLIWFHAASVGESLAILSLVNKIVLETDYNILLTSYTFTSSKIVLEKFPSKVIHQFLPYDSPFFAKRLVNHWKPDLVLWTESDFWPNILTEISKRSRLILLNSRMSDISFARWQKFPGFIKYILGLFKLILPQSSVDYKKMEALGASHLEYIGNLKYCSNVAIFNNKLVDEISKHLKMRKIIFIASTHPGEEQIILSALREILSSHPEVLIFLAPRHPSRTEEVMEILKKLELRYTRRSKSTDIKAETQVFLIDSLGEMNNFYKLSHITIMGGSFVNIGGHNIIEPAKLENVIITGPYMGNFRQAIDEFLAQEAVITMTDASKISLIIESLLKNPIEMQKYSQNALRIAFSYEEILPKTFDFVQEQLAILR